MKILVCPMAFKGTLTAKRAADRIEAALRRAGVRGLRVRKIPFADGGDGTAEVLRAALGGSLRRLRVTGPLGRTLTIPWLWIAKRRLAVADAASICGLVLVPPARRDPMRATSRGLGEWIRATFEAGARQVWIGLGGTATVDGGIGALSALGVRFLDARGCPVGEGGAALARVARIDRSAMDPGARARRARIRLLCDVRSPLLGAEGAARMFGPQKGAAPAQVRALERGMRAYARAIRRECGTDVARLSGAGAAGGIAAGFAGVLGVGAKICPGAPLVARAVDLVRWIRRADLVVTGEGRLDAQTLQGKGVAEICRVARRWHKPVVAVVGRNALSDAGCRKLGIAAVFQGPAAFRDGAAWIRGV